MNRSLTALAIGALTLAAGSGLAAPAQALPAPTTHTCQIVLAAPDGSTTQIPVGQIPTATIDLDALGFDTLLGTGLHLSDLVNLNLTVLENQSVLSQINSAVVSGSNALKPLSGQAASVGDQITAGGSKLTGLPILGGILGNGLTCTSNVLAVVQNANTGGGPTGGPGGNGGPSGGGASGGQTGNQSGLGPTQVASPPRIKGKGRVGKRLVAVLGTLTPGTTVSYQWFRKHKRQALRPIAGATGPSLKLKRGLKHSKITLVVTYVQTQHTPTSLGTNQKRVR